MDRTYRCEPLQDSHGLALASLFAAAGAPCFCRWWDFQGDKNEWLDRCYNRPEENRAELLNAVQRSALSGIVAFAPGDETRLVGWLRLSEASQLPKLYEQRLYRGLPCFQGERRGVMTIGCFLVHPTERRQGVARALLERGLEVAEEQGATAVEAFPRRDAMLGAEALWTGPYELLTALGFQVVNDFAPYPVMRLDLHA